MEESLNVGFSIFHETSLFRACVGFLPRLALCCRTWEYYHVVRRYCIDSSKVFKSDQKFYYIFNKPMLYSKPMMGRRALQIRTKKEPGLAWLKHQAKRVQVACLYNGYKKLVDLTYAFLNSTPPDRRRALNLAYIDFYPHVEHLIHELRLGKGEGGPFTLRNYYAPANLLGLEKEFREPGATVTRDTVRSEMEAAHMEIKKILRLIGADIEDIPEEFQKYLDEIDNVLYATMPQQETKTSLAGKTITYDKIKTHGKTKLIIKVDKKECEIKGATTQSLVAKQLFSKLITVGRSIHWTDAYRAINPGKALSTGTERKKQYRTIMDAVEGINENIIKDIGTNDRLFDRDGDGYIIRNF